MYSHHAVVGMVAELTRVAASGGLSESYYTSLEVFAGVLVLEGGNDRLLDEVQYQSALPAGGDLLNLAVILIS